MKVRAVRGAITTDKNERESIISAAKELLSEIVKINKINIDDIISIVFTVTHDLDSAFPAAAARELGWKHVPVMCALEIGVPGSLPKCIRLMMHVNSDKKPEEIKHIYLKDAKDLRKDLTDE